MIKIIDTFIAPPCLEELEVLFEDEFLLIINKPSGLLSLSGKNPRNKDSVHFRLVKKYPEAKLTHRLDFGTSGVMIIARNKQVNAAITKQFQEKYIDKTYKAVLSGVIKNDSGVIDLPIARDRALFPRLKICHESGKRAVTNYFVERREISLNQTHVRFEPETGRTHQLRIHRQAIAHPILGCDLYADDHTKGMADRLLLHAESMRFTHPISGTETTAFSECPF